MSSKRSYRNSLPLDVIKDEFIKNKGTQFDPDITDVFLDILNNHFDEIQEIQEKYTGIEDEDF